MLFTTLKLEQVLVPVLTVTACVILDKFLNLSVPALHIIRGCLLSDSTESTGFQPQYARTPFILFLHALKSSVSKAFHSVQSWQSELLLMLISSCYNHSPNTTEACHGYG